MASTPLTAVVDRNARLEQLVGQAADDLDGATALEILKWADSALDGRMVVASSMQDAVLVDLAAQIHPGVDVLFLDTGYHFAETNGMRDAVAAAYQVRVLTVLPGQTVAEQDAAHGPRLHDRDPDRCCYLRKVAPLNTMLGLYDGWVTGLRRAESPSRADAAAVEWDARREMVKVNPIVDWSDAEVQRYINQRGVLVNPLVGAGYASIGCIPCTSRVAAGDDARSGRWAGTSKLECGIHQ